MDLTKTQNVIITPVGPQSTKMTCPFCQQQINTEVRVEYTTKTHLAALALCLLCCLGCVPYCMDSCKAKRHFCTNCKAYLGTYESW